MHRARPAVPALHSSTPIRESTYVLLLNVLKGRERFRHHDGNGGESEGVADECE